MNAPSSQASVAKPVEPKAPGQAPPPSRAVQALKDFHEEGALGKAYDSRLMKRLWPFIRPYRKLFWISLGITLLTACGALVRPLIMMRTIDDGVLRGDGGVLLRGGLLLVAIVLVEQDLLFVQIYSIQIVGASAMADLRRHVFSFLHELRLGFFDNQPVGRLVTRVTNDVDAILELFASGALNAFGDLVRLVGIVVLMLSLDWKLSLIGFAAAPPVALLVLGVRKRMRELFREIRAKTARMNSTMNEQVAGMGVIQAFNRQEAAKLEFDEINRAYREANMHSIKFEAMQDAAIETVAAVCLASIIVSLGYRPVSFGTIVAFSAYLGQFFEPVSALAQRYTLLQSAMAGAERVFGLLDSDALDAPRKPPRPSIDPAAAVSFENVEFAYKPGVPVLRNVSFDAKPGEKIAFVGPTGAGKTTVTALLLRLYDIQSGVVRVSGQDVVGLDRTELRQRFAVVPQDVYLFPGSIASNVAGGEVPDMPRVERALHRIGAYELFANREGGLQGSVAEHASNFSAGERQLIAFARALYRDAPILILDEATASVDSDTEARLQRALEELLRGRTALIIAHRLSTIRRADRIIVFHKGRIVEQGSHEQLLQSRGLYAKLHELQFARETHAPAVPTLPPPPVVVG